MLVSRSKKIFCIGANKTGTTSVERALIDLGYRMGDQRKALNLIEDYKRREFKSIVRFCKTAEAFQDAPFSWPYTFMFLDQAFKQSKFILTIRDDEEVWYESLVRFHSNIFGTEGLPPTVEQLKNAKRNNSRSVWDNMNVRHDLSNTDPYDKKMLTDYYLTHNKTVRDYFRFRDNLLVINLKDDDAYPRFCDFLGRKPMSDGFPWKNRSQN